MCSFFEVHQRPIRVRLNLISLTKLKTSTCKYLKLHKFYVLFWWLSCSKGFEIHFIEMISFTDGPTFNLSMSIFGSIDLKFEQPPLQLCLLKSSADIFSRDIYFENMHRNMHFYQNFKHFLSLLNTYFDVSFYWLQFPCDRPHVVGLNLLLLPNL